MQNNSLFKSKILQFIDVKGISRAQFYRETGITRSTLDKPTGLSEDNIAKFFAAYPDVSSDWLLKGSGQMMASKDAGFKNEQIGIPLLPIDAMAGLGGGEVQVMDYEGKRYLVPEFNELGVEFMIMVKGDSMLPKYKSGDLLGCKMLKTDTFFQWNQVYVLTTDQGPVIKRIVKGNEDDLIICVSENQDYAPFELHRDQWYDIAIVLGMIRLE